MWSEEDKEACSNGRDEEQNKYYKKNKNTEVNV